MTIKQIVGLNPYQDPAGNVLANGLLTLDLSQPATVTGTGEIVPLRISVALNSSGTFAATNLWANDQLTPSGTSYYLRVHNNNGLLAADWGALVIQGASPIDISALTPVATGGGLVSVTGVPQMVATINLTNQFNSINPTTIYTVPTAGTGIYRASMSAILTAQGTAGNLVATLNWNNGTTSRSTSSANLSLTAAVGTENDSFNNGAANYSPVNFYCPAGNVIFYSVSLAGATGSPQFSFYLRLEYLG